MYTHIIDPNPTCSSLLFCFEIVKIWHYVKSTNSPTYLLAAYDQVGKAKHYYTSSGAHSHIPVVFLARWKSGQSKQTSELDTPRGVFAGLLRSSLYFHIYALGAFTIKRRERQLNTSYLDRLLRNQLSLPHQPLWIRVSGSTRLRTQT